MKVGVSNDGWAIKKQYVVSTWGNENKNFLLRKQNISLTFLLLF